MISLDILKKVFYEEAFLSDALDHEARFLSLPQEKKRFVRRLTKGVAERRITLSAIIRKNSNVRPEKMKKNVYLTLCMALYEMLYMNTSDHAVVNEAVEIIKKAGPAGLSGFVNGFLRNALRSRESLFTGLTEAEIAGVTDEMHGWFVSWYGKETAGMIEKSFTEEDRGLSVRWMTTKCEEDELISSLLSDSCEAEKSGITDHTLILKNVGDLTKLQAFRKNLFYIQDVSSTLDAEVIVKALQEDGNVSGNLMALDTCSSPGGKSLDLKDLLIDRVSILSCDVNTEKTKRIEENIVRFGFSGMKTAVQDGTVYREEWEEAFDIVIADVPCSGLGTISKKPEIRFRTKSDSLRELEEIQKKILENAAKYVKCGGYLLYSTCTVNPGENKEQIDAFLLKHKEFFRRDLTKLVPECYLPGNEQDIPNGYFQVIPGLHPSDGFFVSLLKKQK